MIRRRFLVFGLLIAFCATLAQPAGAGYRGRWVLLGERVVTDRLDHDTIVVTGLRGFFRGIEIRVLDRAVQFHDVKIRFANGDDQDVAIRDVIPAGGASRVIDIPGNRRVIRSIDFWYDAQSIRGRTARVRVFGVR